MQSNLNGTRKAQSAIFRWVSLNHRFYPIKYTEIQSHPFAKTVLNFFVKSSYMEYDLKFQKETREKKGQYKLRPPSN